MAAVLGLERGTLRRDLVLAVAYLAGGLVLFTLTSYNQALLPWPERPPGLFLATLTAAVVAIGLRRVAPVASVSLGMVAVLADLALGASLATVLAFTQVLFDGCVYGSPRMWRWLLRTTLATTGLAVLAGVAAAGSWQGAQLAVLVVLIGVLPVVSGIGVRQYRDQAEAERVRAEQTAHLVELDRRQAVTVERTRMARELHDVIANHLSAVAIHATAALSVRGLDRSQVDHALRVIRENSVQGLAEMRQMIELLRDPGTAGAGPPAGSAPDRPHGRPPGYPPGQPPGRPTLRAPRELAAPSLAEPDGTGMIRVGLGEVERLAGQARRAGLEVRLSTSGTVRPLPVSVDLAAYRIVQESLTNALKHGAGTAAVTIAYRPARISVTVENPLPEPARARAGGSPDEATVGAATAGAAADVPVVPGAGAGLVGMRERATLLDGRFEAGPRQRHWRVYAELPTARRTR